MEVMHEDRRLKKVGFHPIYPQPRTELTTDSSEPTGKSNCGCS